MKNNFYGIKNIFFKTDQKFRKTKLEFDIKRKA